MEGFGRSGWLDWSEQLVKYHNLLHDDCWYDAICKLLSLSVRCLWEWEEGGRGSGVRYRSVTLGFKGQLVSYLCAS
jgi:hypothetical protein